MIALPAEPQRILLIKPSAIGDVVHTLPVLHLLRKRWPSAHIAWLVTPACSGLIEGHPQLSETILFDRRGYGRSWRDPSSAFGLLAFHQQLRRGDFDLVIDLQGLFRSGWLAWQTRAATRVGFKKAREFAHLFYTHRVDVGSTEQHATQRYLKVAAELGCDVSDLQYPFHVTADDRAHVDQLLGGVERYAVMLPGTNWATKRWPVERFAALVPPLRERFDLQTVIAGGPDDAKYGDAIASAMNLAGKTTLRQLVALLERAAVVIANDSGPMHIAAALNRPLVALYGPTNPVRTGPFLRDDAVLRLDIPCSPCYSRKCSHQSCLQWLGIEPVIELAREQMGV